MRKKPGTKQSHGEKVVKDIRRATRKQYTAEEKIRIVLDGLNVGTVTRPLSERCVNHPCERKSFVTFLELSWQTLISQLRQEPNLTDRMQNLSLLIIAVFLKPVAMPLRSGS